MWEHDGASSYHRYLEGEQKAFDEIIDLYKNGLIGFIYRYVGNWDAAEDISEDCFVELIVRPKRYGFKSSLKTYLYGIAHNKSKEYLRRNKSVSFTAIEESNPLFSCDCTHTDIITAENQDMICYALSLLPQDYREVLHLHYFEGVPYKDIGKVMRKSLKQVYNLASRAKKMLKENLERDGFIYEE